MPIHASSRERLAPLRLVNKTFHAAVTPIFYRELYCWSRSPSQIERLRWLVRSPDLAYVKSFHFFNSTSDFRFRDALQLDREQAAGLLIQAMPPRLKHFGWDGALSAGILRDLHHSSPLVSSMQLTFPDDFENDLILIQSSGGLPDWQFLLPVHARAITEHQAKLRLLYQGTFNLAVFSHLEVLKIGGIFGDLPWWASHLAYVFKSTPRLRELGLAVSSSTILRLGFVHNFNLQLGFFGSICKAYGEIEARRLKLRSIHFGHGVRPYSVEALEKLTDLSLLEEVYINNSSYHHVYGQPIYKAFGPSHCPNLRRFRVQVYDHATHQFLVTSANSTWARQVAISSTYHLAGQRVEPAMLLRPMTFEGSTDTYGPYHFRMLEIDLVRNGHPIPGRLLPAISAREVLESVTQNDNGALEGLVLSLPVRKFTGSVGLGFFQDILDAVPKLANLAQLGLASDLDDDETTKFEPILDKVARDLAAASPSLRYLQVFHRHYKIHRARRRKAKLRVMEEPAEIDAVELFSKNCFDGKPLGTEYQAGYHQLGRREAADLPLRQVVFSAADYAPAADYAIGG